MKETGTNSAFDDPVDAEEEARLDAAAEAEIDTGRGVPHPQVRAWLRKLLSGEVADPPIT